MLNQRSRKKNVFFCLVIYLCTFSEWKIFPMGFEIPTPMLRRCRRSLYPRAVVFHHRNFLPYFEYCNFVIFLFSFVAPLFSVSFLLSVQLLYWAKRIIIIKCHMVPYRIHNIYNAIAT